MKTTLREFASALKVTKLVAANAVDGKVVGIDTVSGGDYFDSMPCIGSVLKTKAGKHVVLVDAIAYDRNPDEDYAPENRFIAVSFDPETLEFTGNRTNFSFKSIMKSELLSVDIFSYVLAKEKEIAKAKAEAEAKALAEKKARNAAAKKSMLFKF